MKINPKLKEDLKKYLKLRIKKQLEKAIITSAYKLTNADWKLIFEKFPDLKNLELEERVSSELMAGIIIQIGSRVTDLSLFGRFKNLKNTLYESN